MTRRNHTLRLGEMLVEGNRVDERHVQLAADWMMDQAEGFDAGDVIKQFNDMGYYEASYRAADRLLQKLRKMELIEYDHGTRMWNRVVTEEPTQETEA